MITTRFTMTLDRALEDVFAFVIDLGNYRLWQPSVSESRAITSGAVRVGTQIKELRTVLAQRVESTVTVAEYQHQAKLVLRRSASALDAEVGLTFSPVWAGTLIVYAASAEPRGLLKTLGPIFERWFTSQPQAELRALDKALAKAQK